MERAGHLMKTNRPFEFVRLLFEDPRVITLRERGLRKIIRCHKINL